MITENEEKIKAKENADLPCSVVRDLLPLYIDNAVSMDTRE